jgi:hypothetical protein
MGAPTMFLAGSIEMGSAKDWQNELVTALGKRSVTILNPRREDWDASWRQSASLGSAEARSNANALRREIDEPQFREQVEWELDGLERADIVAMWFAPDTRAPITLLELGLTARGDKLVVGCPDGFWRKGNIEVVCSRFGIPLTTSWAAFVAIVCAKLDSA